MEYDALKASFEDRSLPFSPPIMTEFARQMVDPPGGDDRTSLFFQGMLDVVHGRNIPSQCKEDATAGLRAAAAALGTAEDLPSYAANKLLRCFQKQFMYRDIPPDYPYSNSSVEPWRSGIVTVLTSDRLNEVIEDLRTRETQSNVVQRYNALKLILALTCDIGTDRPQLLDIGCSQNLGLKKLALGGRFEDVKIVEPSSGTNVRQNDRATRMYNYLLSRPLQIGRSLGVDLYDLRDEKNAEWVYACSNYPGELLNHGRLEEARQLYNAPADNVSFVQSNIFTKLTIPSARNRSMVDRRQYDAVFVSTAMYQMTKNERESLIQLVFDRLTDTGFLAIQDFVRIRKNGLQFAGPGSDRFAYRTVVLQKQTDFDRPEELLIWETARCRRARLGVGKLIVEGTFGRISDVLQMAAAKRARH